MLPAARNKRRITSAKAGLVAGYVQGRLLTQNQRVILWRDLGRRMGDQSYRGPAKQWGQRQWRDWYTDLAAVFRGYHLEPAG